MRVILFLLILPVIAYADGVALSLGNSIDYGELFSISARYDKTIKNGDSLVFAVNYMPHGNSGTSMAHDIRLNAGYRIMPVGEHVYVDAGAEYRYLYFDRTGASFTENSLGVFAALGVKTKGAFYGFIVMETVLYLLEPKSYRGGNSADSFETRQWRRSHYPHCFVSLGIGYSW
jgi:hypothetical protein